MRISLSLWIFLMILIGSFSFYACKEEGNKHLYTLPAEFDPQEAVWLSWSDFEDFQGVGLQIIENLKDAVQLHIICSSDSLLSTSQEFLDRKGIDWKSFKFYVLEDGDFWIRDHGALFTVNQYGQMIAVDFEWSNYGYREWLMDWYEGNEDQVDSVLYESGVSDRGWVDMSMADFLQIPVLRSWLQIEGGALEVNGRGTALLNEPLTLSRNPDVEKEEIEKELARTLGIKKVIWLGEGLAEDPHVWRTIGDSIVGLGTGGHIDEYARFVTPSTVFLAWVPEEEKNKSVLHRINHERMSRNYEILSQAKDQDGKALQIVKVPMPEPILKKVRILPAWSDEEDLDIPEDYLIPSDGWRAGDQIYRVAASSYLNFFISNDRVLVPSYVRHGDNEEKEAAFVKLLTKYLPGKKIVLIDALPLNWRGGGIHCATMQQSRRKQKK